MTHRRDEQGSDSSSYCTWSGDTETYFPANELGLVNPSVGIGSQVAATVPTAPIAFLMHTLVQPSCTAQHLFSQIHQFTKSRLQW